MPNLYSLLELSGSTGVSASDAHSLRKVLGDLNKPHVCRPAKVDRYSLIQATVEVPPPEPKKRCPKKKLSEIKQRMFYSRAFIPKGGASRLHRLSLKIANKRKIESKNRLSELTSTMTSEQYFRSSQKAEGSKVGYCSLLDTTRDPKLKGKYKKTLVNVLSELSNSSKYLSLLADIDDEQDDHLLLSQTPTSSISGPPDFLAVPASLSATEAAVTIQATWRGHFFRSSVRPNLVSSHLIKRVGRGYYERRLLSKRYTSLPSYQTRLSAVSAAVVVCVTAAAPLQIIKLVGMLMTCSPSQLSSVLSSIDVMLNFDSLLVLRQILFSKRNTALLSKLLFPSKGRLIDKVASISLVLKALKVTPLTIDQKRYLLDIRITNMLADSRPAVVAVTCEVVSYCVCYETRCHALCVVSPLDKLMASKKIRKNYPALKSVILLATSLMVDISYSKYLFNSKDFRSAVICLVLHDTPDGVTLPSQLLSLFAKWCSQDDSRRLELEAKVAQLESQIQIFTQEYS
eukprot:TRINITY_DN14802_c0_g1_i1.p1 TRINITY_DN14802_c0_g1~~TRINITY_DN14802_c0_g1_i1.p1  ORF type:complete len:514 (+),score=70.98 TRINITY_DN14802_c0_g1_i1:94-1635(+)